MLRFYEDLAVDQIAERTGARVGTVKSRLHYALRDLRAVYGAEDAAPSRDGSGRGARNVGVSPDRDRRMDR